MCPNTHGCMERKGDAPVGREVYAHVHKPAQTLLNLRFFQSKAHMGTSDRIHSVLTSPLSISIMISVPMPYQFSSLRLVQKSHLCPQIAPIS